MFIRPFAATIAASSALFTAVAAGQIPQAGTPVMPPAGAGGASLRAIQSAPQGADGPIVSIEFGGGTLGDLVKTLQGQAKEAVNIALQGDAAAIPVEPMVLRNVTVHAALEAAIGARVGNVMYEPDGTSKQIIMGVASSSGEGAPVFVVTRRDAESRQMGREPVVQVYSIQKLVSGSGAMSPDVLLTAIDTGLGLQTRSSRTRPEIKLHKDSGLLLVRGDPADVNLIEQIVSRLQKDHERQVAEESRRKAFEIDRATRRKKAESIIRENDAYLASSGEQIKRLEAAIKEGTAGPQSPGERMQLDTNRSRAAETRDRAQADLDRIKAETDAGLGADGSPADAAGTDGAMPQGEGVREERIRALEARIAALEADLAANRSQGVRQRSR